MSLSVLSQSEQKHLLQHLKSACPLEPRWACMLHALGDNRMFVGYRGESCRDDGSGELEYEVAARPGDYASIVYLPEKNRPDRSLDTITDLIERALPNCAWGVSVEPPTQLKPPFDVTYHAYIADHWPHLTGVPAKWQGDSSYTKGKAMALCIAFLKVLISKSEQEVET